MYVYGFFGFMEENKCEVRQPRLARPAGARSGGTQNSSMETAVRFDCPNQKLKTLNQTSKLKRI
jgi:hypothetical protein